ncbi:MAG TPA: serine hydrolase, partial [Sphingomonas sp.]|nr:serine hydrolase [Sphingomonas sp.]
MACGVLALATPAHAAEPTPYQRALAAGYKAAFLCSGIFNAGRTQAQIEALELTGIYPEYDAIVPTLPASFSSGGVYVEFDPALPPRQAVWNEATGCTTRPIGAGPFPIYIPATQLKPSLSERPWPDGDKRISDRPAKAAVVLTNQAFGGAYGKASRTVAVLIV